MCLWIIIDDRDIMHPIRKGGQDEHRRICRAEQRKRQEKEKENRTKEDWKLMYNLQRNLVRKS